MQGFKKFDIIIIGGGLTGMTVANLLAKNDLSVALIETHPPKLEWDPLSVDMRCSAINRASQNILKSLDAWPQKLEQLSAFDKMVVWDGLGFGRLEFNAEALAEPYLGHIVENRELLRALWKSLTKYSNAEIFNAVQPQSLKLHGQFVEITLSTQQTLITPLVIGADGANSWLKAASKIESRHCDHSQMAIVATVKTTKAHQQTALQRFLPEGPLAFLPLKDKNLSSIVWTLGNSQAETLMQLNISDFQQRLSHALDFELGQVVECSKRASFALHSHHAKSYSAKRCVLIGDAAHTIHPLAGLGVNLGLLDAASLSELIIETYLERGDWGHAQVLKRYERRRRVNNLVTLEFVDKLNRIFKIDSPTMIGLRSFGMAFLNQSSTLKRQLIEHAMGMKGDLPKVAQLDLHAF